MLSSRSKSNQSKSFHSILYLGSLSAGSTSCHRAKALQRLGHEVIPLDPYAILPQACRILQWIDWHTGFWRIQRQLLRCLRLRLEETSVEPSLIWVNSGELFGPSILRWLKFHFRCPLVLYCNDDPTGPREWSHFSTLRRSFVFYDLGVCPREVNELEWISLGMARAMRVWFSYDELAHFSQQPIESPDLTICFLGRNFRREQRDGHLLALLERGVPLVIYGDRWQHSPYWHRLQPFYYGTGLKDAAYAAQLSKSALSLGFLSHGNRDLHTTRSAEVPAAGGALLAERTSEHQLLYEDGVEALFWDTPEECSALAKKALSSQPALMALRHAAHHRVCAAGMGNEDICRQVLAAL